MSVQKVSKINQLAKFQLSKKQSLKVKGGNDGDHVEGDVIIIEDEILE